MPIRPENRDRYPRDWAAISLAIKTRAGWRCECEGECGRATHAGRCLNRHGEPAHDTGSRVVLTTAHLNHTPEDCTPGNLKAMCNGCHLHYDLGHHRVTAAATRAAAIAATGQLTLLTDEDLPPRTEPPTRPPPQPSGPAAGPQPALIPTPRGRSTRMARISIKTVPVHRNDPASICEHPTAPTGKPRDPAACPGRGGYRIHCTACGGLTGETHSLRTNADSARKDHSNQHLNVNTH